MSRRAPRSERLGQPSQHKRPDAFSGGFSRQVSNLVEAIGVQDGARLPGGRRQAARQRTERDGVSVDAALIARIEAIHD